MDDSNSLPLPLDSNSDDMDFLEMNSMIGKTDIDDTSFDQMNATYQPYPETESYLEEFLQKRVNGNQDLPMILEPTPDITLSLPEISVDLDDINIDEPIKNNTIPNETCGMGDVSTTTEPKSEITNESEVYKEFLTFKTPRPPLRNNKVVNKNIQDNNPLPHKIYSNKYLSNKNLQGNNKFANKNIHFNNKLPIKGIQVNKMLPNINIKLINKLPSKNIHTNNKLANKDVKLFKELNKKPNQRQHIIQDFVHIADRVVPPRAIAVLPAALQIKNETIFSCRPLPPRLRFGPVQGVKRGLNKSEFRDIVADSAAMKNPVFFLGGKNNEIIYIDTSDKDKANWLCLLPVGDYQTANVWLYEENNELYGFTTKYIPAKTPLTLGYNKAYADKYKLPTFQPILDLTAYASTAKKWSCEKCKRTFSTAVVMQRHLDFYHKNDKPEPWRRYCCKQCASSFDRYLALKRHESSCDKLQVKLDVTEPTEKLNVTEVVKTPSITKLIIKPDVVKIIQKPIVTVPVKHPNVTEGDKKPNLTELIEKAHLTQLIERPIVTEINVKPNINENILKPNINEIILKENVAKPIELPNNTDAADMPNITDPSDISNITDPTDLLNIPEPSELSNIMECIETTNITECTETQNFTKCMETPDINECLETPNITECMETPNITECLEFPNITECLENTNITECLENTNITECLENTNITECLENTNITECLENTNITECMEASDITECMETPNITECIDKLKQEPLFFRNMLNKLKAHKYSEEYDKPSEENDRFQPPSEESLENFANSLELSSVLFDNERLSDFELSNSSRPESALRHYEIREKDENSLINDIEFMKFSEDVISNDPNAIDKEKRKVSVSCVYCKQNVLLGERRQHVYKCNSRRKECKCGRVFINIKRFIQHIFKEHSKDIEIKVETKPEKLSPELKKYECEDCRITFKRRGMLVNHLWRVHKVKTAAVPVERRVKHYLCVACPKIYRTAAKRNRHVRLHHPGEEKMRAQCIEGGVVMCKPAACNACPRQYATRAKLMQHVRMQHPHLAPPSKKRSKTNLRIAN